MGAGINSINFGNEPGKIKVKFTLADGSIQPDGYIVSQIGAHRYTVSDGTHTRNLYLAQTTDKAETLGDESMTIFVTPYGGGPVEHACNIQSCLVYTCEGNAYSWQLGVEASAPGQATIQTI